MAMPTERRILLIVLAAAIAAAAAIVLVPILRTEKMALEERIARHENQLLELMVPIGDAGPVGRTDVEALRERYDSLAVRFYRPDEIDPYSFASEVSRLVTEHGLVIERSQPFDDDGGGRVEFVLRGRVSDLFSFLAAIAENEHFWSVPFVSITTDTSGSTARIRLQVGYETLPDNGI